MPENESKKQRGSRATTVLWVAVLLVVYALSIGPVTWILVVCHDRFGPSPTTQTAVSAFYWPIVWLRNNTDFGDVIWWYQSLFLTFS